jgi:hypothetical protein
MPALAAEAGVELPALELQAGRLRGGEVRRARRRDAVVDAQDRSGI